MSFEYRLSECAFESACQSLATLGQRHSVRCSDRGTVSQRECAGITDLPLSFTRTRIALTEAECAYSQRLSFQASNKRGEASDLDSVTFEVCFYFIYKLWLFFPERRGGRDIALIFRY